MDLLKLALTTLPILMLRDYFNGASEIIHAVNASLERWREILIQLV